MIVLKNECLALLFALFDSILDDLYAVSALEPSDPYLVTISDEFTPFFL